MMTLHTIYEDMLEAGRLLYVTFIDYRVAFDTVSHKFLYQTLKEVNASDKTRTLL